VRNDGRATKPGMDCVRAANRQRRSAMSPEIVTPKNSWTARRIAHGVGQSAAVVCLIALTATLGCSQGPLPSSVPLVASLPPKAAAPIFAPPLTDPQKGVLKGKFADFVPQFAAATGIRLVPIPAGAFMMGSPATERGRQDDEGPQTRVTLTKDFFLGSTCVTQGQWTAVMGSSPSLFKGDTLPVDSVTWDDAMAFCEKLTERERVAGRLPEGYALTLPTEAQREYACRAGTTGPNAGNLDAMAWYNVNSEGTSHPVGTKQPNAWGLFDLQGNVWEWCADWYASYSGGAVTDPAGPASGSNRVLRGGSWFNSAALCRSARRYDRRQGFRADFVGFRVALSSVR
jgi:formylglycine-generating enzyme required for sulfatase activity